MTRVVAHRGARGLVHHGNTLDSFELAIAVGAPWLELDLRSTADDVLVAHHDAEVGGTPLARLTVSELRVLAETEGYRPPTFDEVLELCRGRARLDVELKKQGRETEVLRALQSWDAHDRWVVKSFHDETVARLGRLDPDATTGLLLGVEQPRPWLRTRWSEFRPEDRVARCDADFVGPNEQLVVGDYIDRMHRRGIEVWAWTVNEPVRMAQLVHRGVDALITDRPDLALPLVRGKGARRGR